ncbi:MAG: Bax inhibitor-1/YccA family membrane protein, partial [Actinomycetota bacterium]
MASQILNEQTYSAEGVHAFTGGRTRTASTMTYGGVIVRALFFLVLTGISATAGWRAAADQRPQSGMWFFLGYLLLIAISLAAARNPRLAAIAGILYALLMGFWMGSISRLYETYYEGIVAQALLASVAT